MKKIRFTSLLLLVISSTAFSDDINLQSIQKELLILSKGVILYENETGNSKKIKTLEFLEKVYLVKESSNKRIYVRTEENKKGWVDPGMTSFISPDWKKIDSFENISIFIPEKIKYSIYAGKWDNNNLKDYKEDKIYAENSFSVLITMSNKTFKEKMENEKRLDQILHRNSNYIEIDFKGRKILFCNSEGIDFTREFFVIIPYKENSYINIIVSLESSNKSYEKVRTALKVLFSYEVKEGVQL